MFLQMGRLRATKRWTRLFAVFAAICALLATSMTGAHANRGNDRDRDDRGRDDREWQQEARDRESLPAPTVGITDYHDGTGQISIDTSAVQSDEVPNGLSLQAVVLQSDKPRGRFKTEYYNGEIPFGTETTVELSNDGQSYTEPTYYDVTVNLLNDGDVVYEFDEYQVMTLEPAPPAPPVPPTITADLAREGEVVPLTIDNANEPHHPLYFTVRVDDEPIDVGSRQIAPGDTFSGEVRVPYGSCLSVLAGIDNDTLEQRYQGCRESAPEPTPEAPPAPTTEQPQPEPEPSETQDETEQPQPSATSAPSPSSTPKVTRFSASPRPSVSPDGVVTPSPQPSPSESLTLGTVTTVPAEETGSRWRVIGFGLLGLLALAAIGLIVYGVLHSVRDRQERNGIAETEPSDDI